MFKVWAALKSKKARIDSPMRNNYYSWDRMPDYRLFQIVKQL